MFKGLYTWNKKGLRDCTPEIERFKGLYTKNKKGLRDYTPEIRKV